MSDERRSREEVLADLERLSAISKNKRQPQSHSPYSPPGQPSFHENRATSQDSSWDDLEPAGFWKRFVAFWIDSMVMWVFWAIVLVPLVITFPMFSLFVLGTAFQSVFFAILLGVVMFLLYGAVLIFFDRVFGGTPGKLLMGVRVFDAETSGPVSYWQYLWRESLGKFVSSIILGLGYVMAGFRDDKKSLHDLLFSTQVKETIPELGRVRWGIAVGIMTVMFLWSAYDYKEERAVVAQVDLQPITSFELQRMINGSSAQGIVINMWGSDCAPCRAEFPYFLKLKREFESKGLQMLFVSVDDKNDLAAAAKFLKRQGVDFRSYYRDEKVDAFVKGVHLSWTGAIPFTLVYDSKREILHSKSGMIDEFQLRRLIEKALNPL